MLRVYGRRRWRRSPRQVSAPLQFTPSRLGLNFPSLPARFWPWGDFPSQTALACSFLRETAVRPSLYDINTVWPSGDLYHNLHIFSSGLFFQVLTVLSKYNLLWERIFFCFCVVSSFVCIDLILEWTMTHSFLFLCSIFFCMNSFDTFSSSLVDSSLQPPWIYFECSALASFSMPGKTREVSR